MCCWPTHTDIMHTKPTKALKDVPWEISFVTLVTNRGDDNLSRVCIYEYAKFQGQQRHLINIYGRWLLHMCSSANPRVYKKNHLSWDPNREVWLPSIVFEEKQLKHWSLPGYLGQFLHVSLLMVISTSGNYLQSFN